MAYTHTVTEYDVQGSLQYLASRIDSLEIKSEDLEGDFINLDTRVNMRSVFEEQIASLQQENAELKDRLDKLEFLIGDN